MDGASLQAPEPATQERALNYYHRLVAWIHGDYTGEVDLSNPGRIRVILDEGGQQ